MGDTSFPIHQPPYIPFNNAESRNFRRRPPRVYRELTSEREWRHQRCLHFVPCHNKSSQNLTGSSRSVLTPWQTDFKTFQAPETKVRRRFTDFVFLYNTLYREYPAVAVPPLPDKHNMAYVRGDRFSTEFTQRRAHSLNRLLKRIALHPELRRSSILLQAGTFVATRHTTV
jgi:hypothetical protein